tara:strand:- start:48 stop:542 length:495 start_codon:yes stop_codon:yes gene_type:complete
MIKKNFFIASSFVLLIFLLDRVSKIYVIYLDKEFFGSEILSSKFLNIRLIFNEGIAFGLFSFDDKMLYHILTILILIVIIALIFMTLGSQGAKKYSLLMILGGALGNVFDRLFYRAVPDFLDFHVGNYHWFIFNVADIFITLGVIFMIILEFIGNNDKNNYEIS